MELSNTAKALRDAVIDGDLGAQQPYWDALLEMGYEDYLRKNLDDRVREHLLGRFQELSWVVGKTHPDQVHAIYVFNHIPSAMFVIVTKIAPTYLGLKYERGVNKVWLSPLCVLRRGETTYGLAPSSWSRPRKYRRDDQYSSVIIKEERP